MSINASDPAPFDRRDLIALAAVCLLPLAVYAAARPHSVAGLFPPDSAPGRVLDDEQVVDYLRRSAGPLTALVSMVAAAAACGTAYLAARMVAATRSAALASALALAFGRTFWEQAELPGVESARALAAGLAVLAALRWHRTSRPAWGIAAIAALLLAAPLALQGGTDPVDAARWLFLEMNAAGIALAVFGAIVLCREPAGPRVVVAIGFALLIVVPLRAGSGPHGALMPAVTALTSLLALGATRLIAFLHQPRWAAGFLALLALIPLAGNIQHVTADAGSVERADLDTLVTLTSGCGSVVGLASTTDAPDEAALVRPSRPGCDSFALPKARDAYEHLGFRFAPGIAPGRDTPGGIDRLSVARLVGRVPCVALTGAWQDITALATDGRIGILATKSDAGVLVYAGRERPLDPWTPASWSVLRPSLGVLALSTPAALDVSARNDGLPVDQLGGAPSVSRIAIVAGAASGPASLTSLDLSGIPTIVLARALDSGGGSRVCAATRGAGWFAGTSVGRQSVRGSRSAYGYGWGPGEGRAGREWRRLAAPEGELLIPLASPVPIEVIVRARLLPGDAPSMRLRINGTESDARQPDADGTYRWSVPADRWRPGTNQVFVISTPGLAIVDVEFVR